MTRMLVVANTTIGRAALPGVLGANPAAVLVIAPALNTRLGHWSGDDRAASRNAEARLAACLGAFAGAGLPADGYVADADPPLATHDALSVFAADEILVAPEPPDRANWLARDLVGRLRARVPLPVRALAVEPEAAAASPATVTGDPVLPWPARRRSGRGDRADAEEARAGAARARRRLRARAGGFRRALVAGRRGRARGEVGQSHGEDGPREERRLRRGPDEQALVGRANGAGRDGAREPAERRFGGGRPRDHPGGVDLQRRLALDAGRLDSARAVLAVRSRSTEEQHRAAHAPPARVGRAAAGRPAGRGRAVRRVRPHCGQSDAPRRPAGLERDAGAHRLPLAVVPGHAPRRHRRRDEAALS
jgi:hypothetical protein